VDFLKAASRVAQPTRLSPSAAARQKALDDLDNDLDEDAEFSRPRQPQMSQAGPSAIALYETQNEGWKKAKLREQERRRLLLKRAMRKPPGSA
jgi:hypothetical protein